MCHPFPGSGRPRAAHEPYGATGRQACANSIQPMYGKLGLAMSGLRPNKQAQMYHNPTAARRSYQPAANKTLRPAATSNSIVTTAGVSHSASTLGNKKIIGLDEACG